jgi:hypothetical protein
MAVTTLTNLQISIMRGGGKMALAFTNLEV